ncbi:hypothetical protein [Pedobacter duraquae]|uniref:Peptidase MA superfamily protein n=1 Tax=Pedobacter duraquae TaxID=425511 RepID=A0A4R6IFB2_9SPHI|nr:hypothetical protein [Pedobacter duraquae]TDO20327.1 hypothetical protein CLV32_4087 [Pedobacter duraquae]
MLLKKHLFSAIILLLALNSSAQITISSKIDTSKTNNAQLIKFINTYFQKDSISKTMWHPKYKNKVVWDYSMDWIWGTWSPKKISTKFDLELVELQKVNDTLSYFKISAASKPEIMHEKFTNVYKYYVVNINGKYYLDNCKPYDQTRFTEYKTKNINFYSSPFYHIPPAKMKAAAVELEKLNKQLKRPAITKPIDYFLCATEEELNNLSNIVIWNGGLGGYTNIPERFIVAISDNPDYKHEFVHALLGTGANCFFLQEGMASLYGGMDEGAKTYEQGIKELKECYNSGDCNFEKLYARNIGQKYSSSLTYTFAAACCKYLINNYGLEYFYKLYYNKDITSENFLEKVSNITGKTPKDFRTGMEKLLF